jgi:hypothetical protein
MSDSIQVSFCGHVDKGSIFIIAIEFHFRSLVRQSEIIRSDIAHSVGDVVTKCDKVLPAVIIVIEKECPKTQDRVSNRPGTSGHVGETPTRQLRGRTIDRTVIVEKNIRAVANGQV